MPNPSFDDSDALLEIELIACIEVMQEEFPTNRKLIDECKQQLRKDAHGDDLDSAYCIAYRVLYTVMTMLVDLVDAEEKGEAANDDEVKKPLRWVDDADESEVPR